MTAVGVVLAAGRGVRAGLPHNKALATLDGRPLLERAVAAVAPHVDDVVVVAHPGDLDEVLRLVGSRVVGCHPGAATRHASELVGVRAAVALGADVVAVHDAARPLVPASVVASVVAAVATWAGVVPGVPRRVPLARPAADGTAEVVPREDVVGVQTPQAVQVGPLLRALDDPRSGSSTAPGGVLDTVEPLLRALPDAPVGWVPGDPVNLKVTWPGDLAVADHLLDDAGTAALPSLRRGDLADASLAGSVVVDGVVATSDALRLVDGDRVIGVRDRAGLVDLVGAVHAGPGVLDEALAATDLGRAVEAAVAAGAVLRVARADADAAPDGHPRAASRGTA